MQNYECDICGAELYWDAKSSSLKCKYCGNVKKVEDFEDATLTNKNVEDENIKETEYLNVDVEDGMVAYECKNCTGTIVTSKTTMAEVCPYCGEAVTITSKSVGAFRPKFLIPFSVDKKQAKKIYQDYVKESKYTPDAFKIDNILDKMQGLYAPFYLHNLDNKSDHVFTGEIVTTRRSGDYRITKHEVYDLKTSIDCKYRQLPTDASVRLDDKMMKCVEPYDYKEIKDYAPAYMSGFLAEQSDEEPNKIAQMAVERSKEGNHAKAKKLFEGYDKIEDVSNNYSVRNHTKDYTMLPVWILNVKYRNKNYQYAINGQTGKITGKLPLDFKKLGIIGGATFAVADVVMALLQMGGVF